MAISTDLILPTGTRLTIGKPGKRVEMVFQNASDIVVTYPTISGTLVLELPIVIVNSNTNVEMQKTYTVNTIASAVTLTLPSVVTSGNEISFIDYSNTFGANNCIIARNGHKIEGLAENLTINVSGLFFTLKYIDATVGFKRIK